MPSIQEYAQKLENKMKPILCHDNFTLAQKLEKTPSYIEFKKDDSISHKLFHSENSKKIHDQLSMKVCEIMVPVVTELIRKTNEIRRNEPERPRNCSIFCCILTFRNSAERSNMQWRKDNKS